MGKLGYLILLIECTDYFSSKKYQGNENESEGNCPGFSIGETRQDDQGENDSAGPEERPGKTQDHDQSGKNSRKQTKEKEECRTVHLLQKRTDEKEYDEIGKQVLCRDMAQDMENQPRISCPVSEQGCSGNGEPIGGQPSVAENARYIDNHRREGEGQAKRGIVVDA